MTARDTPIVSIVLATHNRRDMLVRTLHRLERLELPTGRREIIVVDNDSTDGSAEAARVLADCVVGLRRNRGSCAKAWGVDRASGRYILFLDDDSYPRPGSVERMIECFEQDRQLAAAGFTVHLPDGRLEGGALPDVFVGCGVGFRAGALRQVGGLDRTFFMQAEEYDLWFRLVSAGWRVQVFDELQVDHLKAPDARRTDRTTYLDIRNNLRLVGRYLPSAYAAIYREDWIQRYAWLAAREGHETAFSRGCRAGLWRARWERLRFAGQRLSPSAFERCFRWAHVHGEMRSLARQGIRQVVFAGLGKNVHAFYRAAHDAGVRVTAIADDHFASSSRAYRGLPVVPMTRDVLDGADAVVVSDMAPVFARCLTDRLRRITRRPVHAWFARTETTESDGQRDAARDAPDRTHELLACPAGA
jgi:GT2 family glycosyltransferase